MSIALQYTVVWKMNLLTSDIVFVSILVIIRMTINDLA